MFAHRADEGALTPSPLELAEARFNPPVKTAVWVTDRAICVRDLLDMLPERLSLTTDQLAGICRHESVFAGGSRLRFTEPETTIPDNTEIKVLWFSREPEPIPITPADILHEDDELVVVRKPAWLPTQGIPSSARYAVEPQLRVLLGISTLMALHRLDRQTSGLVVFAKDGGIAGRYMQLFTQRLVEKRYLAVTTATPAEAEWTMQGYIGRDFSKLPRVYFRLTPDEQPKSKGSATSVELWPAVANDRNAKRCAQKSRWSETHFRVRDARDGHTLLDATPITGRTHQIRVHLAACHCYVWGDTQYGYPSPAKHAPASRLQLHAHALSWPNAPRLRVPARSFTAEPPADFLFPTV